MFRHLYAATSILYKWPVIFGNAGGIVAQVIVNVTSLSYHGAMDMDRATTPSQAAALGLALGSYLIVLMGSSSIPSPATKVQSVLRHQTSMTKLAEMEQLAATAWPLAQRRLVKLLQTAWP